MHCRPDAAEGTADADAGDSAEAPAKSLMERQEEERHRKQEALVRVFIAAMLVDAIRSHQVDAR